MSYAKWRIAIGMRGPDTVAGPPHPYCRKVLNVPICSFGPHRTGRKPVSVYWAWFPVQNDRRAYRVRYCVEHSDLLRSVVSSWQDNTTSDQLDAGDTCWNCGTAMDTDVWCVTYATIYIPQREPISVELWSCEPCAVQLRSHVVEYGARLADRDGSSQAPRASVDPWAMLIPAST